MSARRLVTILSAVGVAGCAAALPTPLADSDRIAFACPAGLITVTESSDGSSYRTRWLGADPADPVSCLSENGAGTRQRKRLFGRWDMNDTALLGGTTEEKATHRQAVEALLSGQVTTIGFILRGRTGEQTVQNWQVIGVEEIPISGKPVRAVKIRNDYTYGGNSATYFSTLWFAPTYGLFVKSEGSLEMSRGFTWRVVSLAGR